MFFFDSILESVRDKRQMAYNIYICMVGVVYTVYVYAYRCIYTFIYFYKSDVCARVCGCIYTRLKGVAGS
jgi:hypothetical protein